MSRPDGRRVSRSQGTYAATSDPPPGARPARDTGVNVSAKGALGIVTRQRDEALAERDALAECSVEQLAREAALSEARREEKERADLLAEALHGAYVTEHRWRLAYEEALTERDHLREVIEFVLSEHHLGYCTLTTGALTILWAVVCKKKEEEEGPSLTNVTVGEQADDATEL